MLSGGKPGVPGMGSSEDPKRPELRPEEVLYVSESRDGFGSVKPGGIGASDERRRCLEEVMAEGEVARMTIAKNAGHGNVWGQKLDSDRSTMTGSGGFWLCALFIAL